MPAWHWRLYHCAREIVNMHARMRHQDREPTLHACRMMLWIVPLAVIFGLIALVLVGISIYLCCKVRC